SRRCRSSSHIALHRPPLAPLFPYTTLFRSQVGRISGVGERRRVRSGEVLFELGEQNTRFFVVIEGAIEIVRPVDGRDERVTVHRSEEHTSELQSPYDLVCRLLLEKKNIGRR